MPPRQAKWKLLSDEELSNVVRSSNSWTDVAKKVQTSHCGKRLSEFKLAIANRNLSTDHFKGLNYERKLKPVSELTRGRRNCAILTRMLEDSGRKYICEICECRKYKPIDNNGRPAWLWQGKITTLEVDHINGNCGDDSLNNLRFLCTTCHTLTPTYGFKKKRKHCPLDAKQAKRWKKQDIVINSFCTFGVPVQPNPSFFEGNYTYKATNGRRHAHVLRKWILQSGKEYICEMCKCAEYELVDGKWQWEGQELRLQVDHIQPRRSNIDDRVENLRFLCPACHSITETWKGKAIGV